MEKFTGSEDQINEMRDAKHGWKCQKRATHRGVANGICLMVSCELYARGWVRDMLKDNNDK